MRIKSKTPICDKAKKLLINRHEVVYLSVAQKLEKSLIKARKQLKKFRDAERFQRECEESRRIEDLDQRWDEDE